MLLLNRYPQASAVGLALLATLGFASKAIWIKLAYSHGAETLSLMNLRVLYSIPILLVVMYWIGFGWKDYALSDLLAAAALGLVGYYLASLLDLSGLAYISASYERMVLYLFPSLVVILSALALKKRVGKRQWAAIAVSYAGVVLLFAGSAGRLGDHFYSGVGLVFASAVAFAVFMVASPVYIQRLGAMRFTLVAMLSSSLAVCVHFSIQVSWAVLAANSLAVHAYAMGLSVTASLIPAMMLSAATARLGASHSSMIATLGPVMTLLLAWMVLKEQLAWHQYAAALLVIAGILLLRIPLPLPRRLSLRMFGVRFL